MGCRSAQDVDAHWRPLLDNISTGVQVAQMLYNEDGQSIDYLLLDVNSVFVGIVGLRKGEVVGRRFTDFYPDTEPAWFIKLAAIVEAGTPERFEMVSESRGDWFHAFAIPLGDHKLLIIDTDVPQRKEMKRKLQAGEPKYCKFFGTSHDCVWWADRYGYIVDASEGIAQMLGYNPKELLGKSWTSFVDDESIAEGHRQWEMRKSGMPSCYEIKLKKQDGSSLWAQVSGSSLWDDDGQHAGALVAFRDIAVQKKSEEIALALVAELEEENKNEQEFVSLLSHELRNPLATMSVALELLELGNKSEATQRTLKTIKRQNKYLSYLVDGLLDVARINMKRLRLNKQTTTLNTIVSDAVCDLRPLFEKKSIDILEDICTQPALVYADVLRINQCVSNMLINALKFTPEKGTVSIALKVEGESAVITIQDNGVGIHPSMLGRVFEPYAQDKSGSNGYHNRGLGLGLPIVKALMGMHGGDVTASSPGLGKGSKFTMRLPIQR